MGNATENAGMFLIQVERFTRVLCTVVQQVCLCLCRASCRHMLIYLFLFALFKQVKGLFHIQSNF